MDVRRSPFRETALRRYLEAREEAVLPRVNSPHLAPCLRLLLGLLAAVVVIGSLAPLPVSITGPSVIVDFIGPAIVGQSLGTGDGGPVAVLCLPADAQLHLRAGLPLVFEAEPGGERVGGRIVAVEPDLSTPDARYRLFGNAASVPVTGCAATVAVARMSSSSANDPLSPVVGSAYQTRVVVGERRIFSVLVQALGTLGL